MKDYKILVINPGSTSTKLSLFINETNHFTSDVFHDSSILKEFKSINDQLEYRMQVIFDFIQENHIDLSDLDAVASRGGPSYSVKSGTYKVNDLLIEDTRSYKGGLYHSSMLGVQMAKVIQEIYGGEIFMSDPTVTDEFQDLARVTGIDGIYRKSICHALNLKVVARKYAKDHHLNYDDLNLIVCHIDGGITITAHRKGQLIDGNDGGGGDGPFTPTRMGRMAISDVINYLWDKPKDEMLKLISSTGGFSNYYNTSNSDYIHDLVLKNDPKAKRLWSAMIYQIAKEIGAMAMVLKGEVDQIILTGGLMRFDDLIEELNTYTAWIAETSVYPGEYEQEALALNTLKVLKGELDALEYSGKPVFEGFKD